MSINTDSGELLEELEAKLKLLDSNARNVEFLENVKAVVDYVSRFDLLTVDIRISSKIFPAIKDRFNKIFTDNYTIFETLDDDLLAVLIKENLEVVFQLTNIIQELLNYILEHKPVELRSIESVLKYLPNCLQAFADHWKNSSDSYKTAFAEELSNIFKVTKYLYARFLCLLELSIKVPADKTETGLLTDALMVICEMPKTFCDIDASTIISSWKCFGTLTAKYSSLLENCLDVRIPIRLLTDDICRLMETLHDHDMEAFRRQLKIITFLRRILFKILTDIFHQQFNNFAPELLIFYVRVLSFSPEYYVSRRVSPEALLAIENDIFKNLDEFLRHLILGQSVVEDHLVKLPDKLKAADQYRKHPLGFLSLLNKTLQIIGETECNWSRIIISLMEDVFETLPYCHKELFLDDHDGGIYQHLIVNVSAAILMHDVEFRSMALLLTYILQDDVFVAVLALEICTLVMSNIPSEECLLLLVNLLHGVDELLCGFFTHRPEMVYLKYLLQRLFNVLPNPLKEHVVRLFAVDQYVQIWRFLGFSALPPNEIQPVLNPVLGIISEHTRSITQSISEDMPLNIAEGFALISTMNNPNIANDLRISEAISFIETFWSLDIDREILNNNLLKYFVFKISSLTSVCVQNANLNPRLVFERLKLLLNNQSYWIPIFKIISSILNPVHLRELRGKKEAFLSKIAELIPLLLKRHGLLREMYLEMLKNVNDFDNHLLNTLLDKLDAGTATEILEYMGSFGQATELSVDNANYSNMNHFKHKCLQWNYIITNNETCRPTKRFKYDIKCEDKSRTEQQKILPYRDDDADSSATEVIDRIKGEVKCLLKVCKAEKLTQKNVADLRIVMSQISSLT